MNEFLGYFLILAGTIIIIFARRIAKHRIKLFITAWQLIGKPKTDQQIESEKIGMIKIINLSAVIIIIFGILMLVR